MVVLLSASRQGIFFAVAFVFLLFITYTWTRSESSVGQTAYNGLTSAFKSSHSSSSSQETKKIWQTAKTNAIALDAQSQDNIQRWITTNPFWRYELITDHNMDTYVLETFGEDHAEITDVFTGLGDSILRADFLRYLVLLGHGGVYSDLDTECLRQISTWIPPQYKDMPDLAVVGIEFDTFGLGHVGALLDLQLINWTLMSRRAGHGLFAHVANSVAAGLRDLAAAQGVPLNGIKASFNDVLATTGPAALTTATWEYLSKATGKTITWEDVTGITEPKLIHDVLILPVTSWGNGQSHSNAGTPDDPAALVHHQFKGGWKVGDHSWSKMKGEEAEAKEE